MISQNYSIIQFIPYTNLSNCYFQIFIIHKHYKVNYILTNFRLFD